MSFRTTLVFVGFCCACLVLQFGLGADDTPVDLTEAMKESLVYLDVATYSYERFQPWKPADIIDKNGYGCAVGPYEVLTTAWTVSDAAFIKVRRYAQNEFIPAGVKVVDYECNLAVLELEKDAAAEPLVPIKFHADYNEGNQLTCYWLSSGGHLTTGRGFLDRAQVRKSTVSYANFLNYIVSNTSRETNRGQVYCDGDKAVGIACWHDDNEAGLISAVTINKFLTQAARDEYKGFGAVGFATENLLDPAMRSFLKMPADLKHGVYVNKVYNLGTGIDVLKKNDVILSIDDQTLNPYGRYLHPEFDRISFHHLITNHQADDTVKFEIWRDGTEQTIEVKAKNFKAEQMLVPYYEYDSAPEYIVTGGFVLQQLTRDYLQMWGDEFAGKVPPHLYHYYHDMTFKPTDERKSIVILSYVLPHDINLGYQGLGRVVVSKFNGMTISDMSDILKAKKLNPDSKFDVIEFEMDYPTVVIDRSELAEADITIAARYGIRQPARITQ
jgi:hypothetical protein